MSEQRRDEWAMTFPIEATVFVAALVLICIVAATTLFATQWYDGGDGGFSPPMPVDRGIGITVDPAVDEFPATTVVP